MTSKPVYVPLLTLGALFLFASTASAAPTAIGAEKCKMCHKVEYDSWAQSKHAKAEPKTDCETCHGPGSDYKSKEVMKDPEKAKAAGLIAKPAKAACTEKCHKPAEFKDEMLTKVHDKKKPS
jgi:hypothetical protein